MTTYFASAHAADGGRVGKAASKSATASTAKLANLIAAHSLASILAP